MYARSTSPASDGFLRERSVTAAAQENAAKTKFNSTETPRPRVAKDDDCRRFTVRSWFVAGGPCLVEVPWSTVVALFHGGNGSSVRRPAKATLETEVSGPAAHPVLRTTGVTVHLANEVDVNDSDTAQNDGENGIDEYTAAASRSARGMPLKIQSTKNKPGSDEVQSVKRKSGRTVSVMITGEEKPSVRESASRRQHGETAGDHSTAKTHEPAGQEFGAAAAAAATVVGFRGRSGDVETATDTQTRRDRPGGACSSWTTPCRTSTNRAITSDRTTTPAATQGRRRRSVTSPARTEGLPSKRRSSPDRKSDLRHRHQTTYDNDATSPTRRPSILTECGLVAGEPIQSPDGVTVVYTRRRRLEPDRSTSVTNTTPSHLTERTQQPATDNCDKLAQLFLLASVLEYRLYDERR